MRTQDIQLILQLGNVRRRQSLPTWPLLGLLVLLGQGCANSKPMAFDSPDQAVKVLVDAARADDVDRLRSIFGSDGKEMLSSGDEVADRNGRQKFVALYDEKHALVDQGADARSLIIGNSDWPFPVPLVKDGDKWLFDAAEGKDEILNRRIGNNELSAIEVCRAIADAQQEYALRDPDNDGVHEYAQKFASDADRHNGLFWRTAEGESPSPMGELVAAASAEGYVRREVGPTPYHGYYYRILTAQGPNAPGGAMDYVSNGRMILGFAVVAYPAEYDNSGIMTFIMAADGKVYQKDLGEKTAEIAAEMKSYDPDGSWKPVQQ